MNVSASVIVVEPAGDRPVLLVGPPRAVAGDITVLNPRDASLVLRDVGLKDLSGKLAQIPARQGVTPMVLRSRQQRQVSIAIALPAATPAGEYRAEIDVMGEGRQAVLHVTEAVSLRVEPRTLWVANEPHRSHRKRLTITNDGNVPAALSDLHDVALRDDLTPAVDTRVVLQALANKPDLRPEEFVVALLTPLRSGGPTVGSLSVGFVGDAAAIVPGETRSVDVEVRLVEPPPPNGRYRARVPVLTETFDVVVMPAATHGHTPDEAKSYARNSEPASARARRKKRGRS